MVSHPENGSDSPIGSNRDRGRDNLYPNTWFPILMKFFMCNSFHNQLYQINLKQINMKFIAIHFNKSTYFIILQTFYK